MLALPTLRAPIALLVLLAAGCGSEGARVVVGLTTDLAVGFEIRRVEATTRIDGVVTRSSTLSYDEGALSLPAELRVDPAPDGARIELAVAAFRDGEASPVVARRAATRAVEGRDLLLPLSLDAACSGAGCEPGTTCAKGACVDPFIAPAALSDYDPRWIAAAPDACKAPSSGAPTVVIGQGEDAFAPLDEGEVVSIEAGPQGGHHVWLALRASGLRQQGSLLTVTGHFPELASDLPAFTSGVTLRRAGDQGCEIYGVRFQVDQGLSVEAIRGRTLAIEVALRDPDGDVATAMKRVAIAP
jgi:hypothetical protein